MEQWKKKVKRVCLYGGLLTLIIPTIFYWFFHKTSTVEMFTTDGWVGFLGGYVGGIATMIAVLITIFSDERKRITDAELEKRHHFSKCATIVYYDFCFAFEGLDAFINAINELNYDTIYLNPAIKAFYFPQLFTDDGWIVNVAELKEVLLDEQIKIVYSTYGNIRTIQHWIASQDDSRMSNEVQTRKAENAINSMYSIQKIPAEGTSDGNAKKNQYVRDESITAVINRLKEISENGK